MKNIRYLMSALLMFNAPIICKEQIIAWNKKAAFNVLKRLMPKNPIILEAGAYDGTDTKELSSFAGKVYAFEPDPRLFSKLKNKLSTISNVIVYPYALCDKIGKATFHQSEDPVHPGNYQSGSLLTPKEHLHYSPVTFNNSVEVETTTIEAWAALHNIERVDFLWLDMQGAELSALKSSGKLLNTVKIIYMEVELVEAYAGQPLYPEVKSWLEQQGFELIAKDFKDGDKKRWYGNIIAVKKSWYEALKQATKMVVN